MKHAFSLIELIIVVVIIGVVYMLAVHNLHNFKDPSTALTLQNLKGYLSNIPHTESVKLLCLQKCSHCDIIVDGQKSEDIDPIEELLDESVKVYRYDFHLGLQEVQGKVYFNEDNIEEKICFSLSVDAKGISEQVAVMFKEKVYDYTSYLNPTPVYDSLNTYIDSKESLNGALGR